MKKTTNLIFSLAVVTAFILTSCSPTVTMTSWKNPKEQGQIANVVVWGMFEKIEYQKPFEQNCAAWLNKQGFKATESMKYLEPGKKHELTEVEKVFDDAGVDGILVVTYQGMDKEENYVPETTTVYPSYYYNYYNYYSWGYPMYGYGANVVTTGGYWTTSSTLKLHANLYANSDNGLLWSADIALVDPKYVDQASVQIITKAYKDWVANGLIKGK